MRSRRRRGCGCQYATMSGIGEIHVLGVLSPGSGQEDPDVGRAVRDPDRDTVVAEPAPALIVGA
ncbi:hypothetical protein ACFCW4_20945 [Streptomyces virginiae]|uniref:hypothetical protein n=1 Tax=Streptomyces virginiae TaxID=1961 RepID=UPI0035D77FAF